MFGFLHKTIAPRSSSTYDLEKLLLNFLRTIQQEVADSEIIDKGKAEDVEVR